MEIRIPLDIYGLSIYNLVDGVCELEAVYRVQEAGAWGCEEGEHVYTTSIPRLKAYIFFKKSNYVKFHV
jgi:hypothetical protein